MNFDRLGESLCAQNILCLQKKRYVKLPPRFGYCCVELLNLEIQDIMYLYRFSGLTYDCNCLGGYCCIFHEKVGDEHNRNLLRFLCKTVFDYRHYSDQLPVFDYMFDNSDWNVDVIDQCQKNIRICRMILELSKFN